MKKIIIAGASGSGKTTLAKQLSKKLNIPNSTCTRNVNFLTVATFEKTF